VEKEQRANYLSSGLAKAWTDMAAPEEWQDLLMLQRPTEQHNNTVRELAVQLKRANDRLVQGVSLGLPRFLTPASATSATGQPRTDLRSMLQLLTSPPAPFCRASTTGSGGAISHLQLENNSSSRCEGHADGAARQGSSGCRSRAASLRRASRHSQPLRPATLLSYTARAPLRLLSSRPPCAADPLQTL
jgi:hypothetical protein